ncbi:hypothetical protein ACH429_23585 [Streptomyces pathocidini]|uniref:Lipoprotein n=1 Tax=Streptomyces pathocidini TaxID=1650571 RepID=A0ABW7UWT2_9ACTN|nr:hypothetical protein [Streptomyces pathocidini]
MTRRSTPSAARRRAPATTQRCAAVAATMAVGVLAAAGCGIRGTSVPVDAGPAPSRASCEAPRSGAADHSEAVPIRVYLVCNTQLVPVDRALRMPEGRFSSDRLGLARALLDELRAEPSGPEQDAGFDSDVPASLEVSPAREGDPAATLRLNRLPDELPSYALGQLVCTYAETPLAAAEAAVLLGGPADDEPRRYRCTESLRAHPDVAQTPEMARTPDA